MAFLIKLVLIISNTNPLWEKPFQEMTFLSSVRKKVEQVGVTKKRIQVFSINL